ncbi:MAG: deiodinase [Alphaproteobacteria bacterium]|nr:deiodinase [Alphaproteobacteria bacterium]
MAKNLGDDVQLLGIYIREAHAEGEDQVPRNLDEGVVFAQPESEDERAEVASACMLRYNFSFPMLLDGMDNDAEEKYISWPDRLYLIDRDGKVAFKSGLGPFYFDVDEFEEAIRRNLQA